jgi:subtilisin family serine protease
VRKVKENEEKHYVRRASGPGFVRSTHPASAKASIAEALAVALVLGLVATFLVGAARVLVSSAPGPIAFIAVPTGQPLHYKILEAWNFGNVTVAEVQLPPGPPPQGAYVPSSMYVHLAPWSMGNTSSPYSTWYASDQPLSVMHYNPTWNGSGVTVAVIDTGIDYLMPNWGNSLLALVSVFYKNASTGEPIVWDLEQNPNITALYKFDQKLFEEYHHYAFLDTAGHGTAVASLIAAQPGYGIVQGLAPGVKLIMIRAFFANGSSTLRYVLTALQWVYNNSAKYNIKVLTLSWGTVGPPNNPLVPAIQAIESRGVIVVAAAGNYGTVPGDVAYPAAAPGVIAVGGFDCYTGQVAAFSSMGPTYSLGVKPQFTACAVDVPVLWPPYITFTGQVYDPYDHNVTALSGTSFSAPAVAAVIADWLEYYHFYHGTWPTEGQLLELLEKNAIHLSYPNDVTGYGIPVAPP